MFDRKEYMKEWHKNNPRDRKEYKKQWRKINCIKIRKSIKQWRENNLIHVKEYMKKYHKDNHEKRNKCSMEWAKENPEKVREAKKKWAENNPEKIKEAGRLYQENNQGKIKKNHSKWSSLKRKTNLKYNLNHKISGEIYKSLKRNKNGWHWEILVGYTLDSLIKHLKKTMPEGYSWQDYMEGKLHIDHKIPISAFNFTKSEHIDFKRCWALSNLRLLPARENIIKSNHLPRPFQPALQI